MLTKKDVPFSRFHAAPRDLSPADQTLIADLQAAFAAVEDIFKRLHGGGASVSAAVHHLEASYMWAMRDFAGINAELPAPAPQPPATPPPAAQPAKV